MNTPVNSQRRHDRMSGVVKECACWFIAGLLVCCPRLGACAPVVSPWPVAGPDDSVAVGAARLSGIYAVGDSYEDNIEVRDIRQNLWRTISAAEIHALLPWMNFSGGPDGPSAIAVSDSGRQVF